MILDQDGVVHLDLTRLHGTFAIAEPAETLLIGPAEG